MVIKMAKEMSAADYAKHRGIALKNVTKAIEEGRISAKKDGRKWVIDQEKADIDWARNTSQPRTNPGGEPAADFDNPSYAQSRAIKEAYLAQLKKLEYERELGALVDADQVRRDGYAAGKLVQSKMLAIPDRLAGQLAGMTDVNQIKRVLVDEIRYALSEVADD
jgi:hypothetical protein